MVVFQRPAKAGDALSLIGLPVGAAVAVGFIGAGSILIPIASLAAFTGFVLNNYQITLDDIFKLIERVNERELSSTEYRTLSRVVNKLLPLTGDLGEFDEVTISNQCWQDFNQGVNWRRPSDPLILDLDGDGVELTPSSSTVLFDLNADGIRTGTQWASADDGILVRDINANGLIDSGRELFGDQTLLATGQVATHGFQALADLDSNADGVFDVSDAAYGELRIWRDLDQDGISDAGELRTLADAGVIRINLGANAQGASTWQRAIVDDTGTVTGSSTQAIRNVNFSTNDFYRAFTDDPALTADALALPQIQGAGRVRDLREAMSLTNGFASALQDAVEFFRDADSAAHRQQRVAAVITAWAATSDMGDAMARNPVPPGPQWYSASPGAAIAAFASREPLLYAQLSVLERFNGQAVVERYVRTNHASYWDEDLGHWVGYTWYSVSIEAERLPFFQASYDALVASTYQNLYLQTEGKALLDQVELVIDDAGLRLDFSALDATLATRGNAGERAVALAEFIHFAGGDLAGSGWDGAAQMAELLEGTSLGAEQYAALYKLQYRFAEGQGNGNVEGLVDKERNSGRIACYPLIYKLRGQNKKNASRSNEMLAHSSDRFRTLLQDQMRHIKTKTRINRCQTSRYFFSKSKDNAQAIKGKFKWHVSLCTSEKYFSLGASK